MKEPALPPASPGLAGRYDVFSIVDWGFRLQRPQQIATQLGDAGLLPSDFMLLVRQNR